MNLDKLSSADYPFKHWEISNCLDANALDEISYSIYQMVIELTMVQELLIIQVKEWMVNYDFF